MKDSPQQEEEFLEFLEANKGLILKVAHGYCHHPEDRRDLVQDIILQLWRAFPKYEAQKAARSTWTYRIALNVSISFLRKHKRKEKLEQGYPLEHEFLQWKDPLIDERLELLYQAIKELKPLEKAQMILHLEGLGQGEIAKVLGIKVSNVSTRLNRIKKKLKHQLNHAN